MNKATIVALAAAPFLFSSCIQDEKENAECDIEAISLHLDRPSDYFFHDYDTLKQVASDADEVMFLIKSYAQMHSVPTTLQVTAGATVYQVAEDGTETPFLNGSAVDYSDERVLRFHVVDEDKVWSRNYSVSVKHKEISDGYLFSDFNSYYLDASGKYYVWDAPSAFIDETGECTWKNGNPGFKISKSSAKPMEYPTTPLAGGGPDGSACVKLETCDTGPFGKMVNMRIASGSMFDGFFDVGNALTNALKATQLGLPFAHKPDQMRVWLRYEPGSTYQDRNANPVSGVMDEPDSYVVFYRNEDENGNKVQLDGSDVLTNPHIVGLGRLPHHYNEDGSDLLSADPIHGVTSEWKEIVIPVVYRTEIDDDILESEGYSLIIGFASSWQGGYFQGAVGSKLFIDNLQLFCE